MSRSPTASANVSEWRYHGGTDPFWAVASWGRSRRKSGAHAWTPREFYATGAADWDVFARYWANYGIERSSCLEVGCGAGRYTHALAETFDRVIGVDVSPGMIATAQQHISATNVEYILTEGLTLPVPTDSIGSVFSTHVFQHLDSLQEASTYFKEIARVLRPGVGSLMIHLPAFAWPTESATLEAIFASRKFLADVKANCLRRLSSFRGGRVSVMRWLSFPIDQLFVEMERLAMTDVEVVSLRAASNGEIHTFVMAKKAA